MPDTAPPSAGEVPFFFRSGPRRLFGVLHAPAGTSAPSAVVFCHPLVEEKLWAHRVFVSYARALAAAGHHALRFDLTGNGDSEGDFSDLSLEVAVADVRAAIDEVCRASGAVSVTLIGLRLGAMVAAMVATQDSRVSRLVLWAPVTDGEKYMQELLRINVMTQMATYKIVRQERPQLVEEMRSGRTVNVDGYELGWPLYSSVAAVRLGAAPLAVAARSLVVQIDKQPRPAADLTALCDALGGATLAFAAEEPFWKEIARYYQQAPVLFEVTSAWLAAQ